ncbi:hypothetical protein LAZ67_10002647 [Cordylochernes scorpioides]|uniref:Uncharacterized protein n=1 Tax=Cordylochernes scorpioides TaxID=51811 RepID=A0ABY6KWQ6_9ARAC|nr:hypothetical protein LAZ67_10002647 [Cordylochernes scorpioides]
MTPQREQLFLNGILDLKLAEFPLKMILVKDAQNIKGLMKMCKKITDLIKENPRTTLLELEQDTGISKTTIGRIVTEDLKLKKTPAKFIPRFLTNEQKLCRLATCEDMMEMTRTDPEWKDKIITGDETWVYGYDPETKPQSAEWRGTASNCGKSLNFTKLCLYHGAMINGSYTPFHDSSRSMNSWNLYHLQVLERDLKNTKKELATLKIGFQDFEGKLNALNSELNVTKKELETTQTKQQFDEKELEAIKIELMNKKEELEIVKKTKKMDSLKKDLQDIKEELASIKTELQGTKEEPATVLQTTATTGCDIKCQDLENPVKLAEVGLDLRLGVQNWVYGVRIDDVDNNIRKYLYGDGDHVDKLKYFFLFVGHNWAEFSKNRSEEIVRELDGTEYNVRTKWKVGGEKIEVEVSFHQRGGGVNLLARYKYFILEVGTFNPGAVMINSVMFGQACRYKIDTETFKKYFIEDHNIQIYIGLCKSQ